MEHLPDPDPNSVHDEASFLAFVRELADDRQLAADQEKTARSPFSAERGWENVTIEGFLKGALAWAADSDFGRSQGLVEDNLWHRFAVFLLTGKIYE